MALNSKGERNRGDGGGSGGQSSDIVGGGGAASQGAIVTQAGEVEGPLGPM